MEPRRPAVWGEAVVLVATAGVLVATNETASGWHERIKERPFGLLAMGGLTGMALVHLWLDQQRARAERPERWRPRVPHWTS